MNAIPSFGEERKFKLASVICLYEEDNMYSGRAVCAATVHGVETFGNKPTVKPGVPITLDALESVAIALGRKLEPCLLPERILAVSLARMVWWCPAERRRIWFNPAEKSKELKALNGKVVAHPHLVFCASGRGGLRVLAIQEGKRPTLETKLFRAPYFNLSPEGSMCEGSVKMPDVVSPSIIEKYEKAFFDSSFSHSNWGHQLTRHPKGHLGLWQEMVKGKSFPGKYLAPVKTTISSLLKGQNDN